MISDPIAAIATAWGDAGVGVVRLSGDGVVALAARFFPGLESRPPRLMAHGPFEDAGGRVLDQVLCVRFAAPASFTGEDVVEIHAHGGYLNLKRILETLLGAGARLARPGEFTQRAFLNGKMDLTRAEAVADLIGARAELSRRAAVRQLEGGLFEAVEGLRARVMDLCAQAEAAVDFPEEQDQIAPAKTQLAQVEALLQDMRTLLKTGRTGRLLREGARVALVGRPNVGKSSLLNALLGSRRAIVADTRGTTRDFLEEPFQVEGFPLVLVDTAGQGDSADPVEAEGIRRSRRQMEGADLRLLVLDRSQPLEPQDRTLLAEVAHPRLVVANKGDLAAAWETLEGEKPLVVSCRTREGLDDLLEWILKTVLGESLDQKVDAALLTRQRHEDSLRKALGFLEHVEQTLRAANLSAEFAAGDLRSALDCLGEIVGKTTREEILNLIFSKFCIGK